MTERENYRFGSIEMNSTTREVRKDGLPLKLTLKEFDLLQTFLANPKRVFKRDEMMDRVWGYRSVMETGPLTAHIRRLREKLAYAPSKPRFLQNAWSVGY